MYFLGSTVSGTSSCTGSGWDGVASPCRPIWCCSLHLQLEQPWYHTLFGLPVGTADTAGRPSPIPPKTSRLGVGKRWAADLNSPKGYVISYEVTLSKEGWERGRSGGRSLIMKTSIFPNDHYRY